MAPSCLSVSRFLSDGLLLSGLEIVCGNKLFASGEGPVAVVGGRVLCTAENREMRVGRSRYRSIGSATLGLRMSARSWEATWVCRLCWGDDGVMVAALPRGQTLGCLVAVSSCTAATSRRW